MTEVISVRFKNKGKVYFFDPAGFTVPKGSHVIVETAKGLEYAECVASNHEVDDAQVRAPLRPVIRLATQEDTERSEENHRRETEAFGICREKIQKHGLDMKLVDVEYNFEGNKILFFFTSEGRVDFRELVKDLASVFKTRIELRQIGVRDEARMLGGLGICGRPFCCAQFLDDFQPVSIKMAKTQGFSLNPTKISGACGRLMCCLKYEQDAYEELVKYVPKVDSFVETPNGVGSVIDVNLLKSTVRVRLEDTGDVSIKTYNASEITVLGGKAKRAEYLQMKAEGKIPETKPVQKLRQSKPELEAAESNEIVPVETEQKKTSRRRKSGSKSQSNDQKPSDGGQKRQQSGKQKQNAQQPKKAKPEPSEEQSQPQTQKQSGGRNRNYRRRKPSDGQGKAKTDE